MGAGPVLQGATATGDADGADHFAPGSQGQAAAQQQQFRQCRQIGHVGIAARGHGQCLGIVFRRQGRVGLAPAGIRVVRPDAIGALHGHDIAATVQYGDDDVPSLCLTRGHGRIGQLVGRCQRKLIDLAQLGVGGAGQQAQQGTAE